MEPNINEFETNIFGDIKNRQFSKAIHLLTQKINKWQYLSADNKKKNGVISTGVHYYLLRSYCNFKEGSVEGLNLALEDVFCATELDENRFQPYLLGALILFDMKRWNLSLQFFEKSIEINNNLYKTFVHKLFYLKFKILSERGVDEELSLKCALSHRYMEECLHNIDSDSEDTNTHINQIIVNHKNEWLASDSVLKNVFGSDKSKTSNNTFSQSMEEYVERWNLRPIDDFFCSGDQRLILPTNKRNNRMTDRSPNIPIRSATNADKYTLLDNKSLESQFKDISLNESQNKQNLNPIQSWIETNFPSDSVSKMCSFDIKPESPQTDLPMSASTADRRNSFSLSDIPSIYFDDDRSSIGSESRQMATNLLKLRGVYVGSIKTKCNEKALKDLFRKYGTIVDFYQPFGVNYAFIHFKTQESALHMLSDWKLKRVDSLCQENKKLMVRFTASQEQMQKYNAMSLDEYKKRCNKAQECHLWRSGKRCHDGPECPFKHIPINRAVDTLPDKRKANWKCI